MLSFMVLNAVLFSGTYLAGCLPISFSFQPSKLRLLTIFGAGLLLGAALVIVIPEGVASLYDCVHSFPSANTHVSLSRADVAVESKGFNREARNIDAKPSSVDQTVEKSTYQAHTADHSSYLLLPFLSASQHIGLALLSGYLFMLLVDQLLEPLFHSHCSLFILSHLFACCRFCRTQAAASTGTTTQSPTIAPATDGRRRISTTLGFVLHAFADGLALGAAFSVNQIRVEVVLFLAIILHKIPAAFGLSCYLIHEGFTRSDIRLHLLIFSAASPVAALVTYAYLALPNLNATTAGTSIKTGFALLLSGGTFLYLAASHILPELITSSSPQSNPDCPASTTTSIDSDDYKLYTMSSHDPVVVYNNPTGSPSDRTKPSHTNHRLGCIDLCVLLIGSIVPLFLTMGHSH